jgi:hypothetical protein
MPELCEHKKWNIDKDNIGTCANPECEEIRQFPFEKGGEVKVIRPSKCNSLLVGEKGDHPSESKKTKKKHIDRRQGNYKNLPTYKRMQDLDTKKDAIITDLFSVGRLATRSKWNISGAGLLNFEKRWLTNEQRVQLTELGKKLGLQKILTPHHPEFAKPPLADSRLPAFPEFSNNWDPAIQLKWLEIYEGLIEIKPVKEVGSV